MTTAVIEVAGMLSASSVDGLKPAISSTGKAGHFHHGDRDELSSTS